MTPEFADAARFVRGHTSVQVVAAVPEIRLLLADDSLAVWEATEAEVSGGRLDPPFWAFAWAGGIALARWVLDHPQAVRGRQAVDVATGSGLVAIAAMKAGARDVTACDVDPLATVAARLNAKLNGVTLGTATVAAAEVRPAPGTVVLAGDVFYQQAMGAAMLVALDRVRESGCEVLVGDPGRSYLPTERLEILSRSEVEVDPEIEDAATKPGLVARLLAPGREAEPAAQEQVR